MDAARHGRLRAFLARGAALPFVWGERDCSLWPCDWIAAERGIDPAADLRGSYASMLSCQRILRRAGGLPTLAGRLADAAGLRETTMPVPGDVGVVETTAGPFLTLCAGSLWAFKAADGLALTACAPSRAWSV